MPGPLNGVNILDLGQAGVGPWAATLLGALGANVVKVEPPGGDRIIHQLPFQQGIATAYTALNMNKRTATVNLKDSTVQPHLEQLVRQADVVMDNLRPGVVERLGLGFEEMQRINPQIISASSPAWGEEGPLTLFPALDPQVQGMSGFASLNGAEGGDPEFLRYPHLDFNASCFLAGAVLLSLLVRERTGSAQRVTASHLGSAIALQMSRIAEYWTDRQIPTPMGSACVATAPHQAFLCRDSRYLLVGVETEAQWRGFCQAIEREELLQDARFATNRARVENRAALTSILDEIFGGYPSRWWALRLAAASVPHGYLYDFEQLRYHQQIVANEYMAEVEVPHQGRVWVGGLPWQFSRTPVALGKTPAPGQHTTEILESYFGQEGAWATGESGKTADSLLPLEGVRVVDATQGYCGPFATLLLAEVGAEVVKVEPPDGDYARGFAPGRPDGDSALFAQLNRNKKSVVLDLDSPEGQAAFRTLVATADVVVEDYGPDVARTRGLDYDHLTGLRPELIYCAFSAFGERGPLRHMPASELIVQGWSNYWAVLGGPGLPPERVGADIVGLGTGVMGFLGILSAIYHRLRTGEGQRVAVSMLGTMVCFRTAQWTAVTGPDRWEGEAYSDNEVCGPYYGNRTKDRSIYFNLNNTTEEQYLRILNEFDMLDEVLEDHRFASAGRDAVGMGRFASEVRHIWDRHFQDRPYQVVRDILNQNGALAMEMRRLDEVFDHPQVRLLGLVTQDQKGDLFLRAPWKGSWEPVAVTPPPQVGEHNVALLGHSTSGPF